MPKKRKHEEIDDESEEGVLPLTAANLTKLDSENRAGSDDGETMVKATELTVEDLENHGIYRDRFKTKPKTLQDMLNLYLEKARTPMFPDGSPSSKFVAQSVVKNPQVFERGITALSGDYKVFDTNDVLLRSRGHL